MQGLKGVRVEPSTCEFNIQVILQIWCNAKVSDEEVFEYDCTEWRFEGLND